MRGAAHLVGSVLLLLSALALATESRAQQHAGPPVVEYLSVEANEGGSSGGHAALRLGDAVYHFQHYGPGVLRLHREEASSFLFTYSLLQNRGVAIDRLTVSDGTYELLRSWFNRHYLTQGMEFDAVDAAHDDRTLIALFLRRTRRPPSVADRDPEDGVALRGAGYFFADGSARLAAAESLSLTALRRKVQEVYGADFIAHRSDDVRAALMHLMPGAGSPFSRRYTDLTTQLAALDVLQHAAALQAGAFHAPPNDEFILRSDERLVLDAFATRLEAELVRLLRSPRPDWGFPLLVGMARLAALQESVRTGRLVFLDAFGAEARVVPHTALRGRTVMMAELLDDARAELQAARRQLTGGSALTEADFTELESASNRFLELFRGSSEGRDVRVQSGPLLPSRSARRAAVIVPRRDATELEQDLAAAEAREAAGVQELRRRYEYNLITKNCVAEIFRGINAALAEAADAADAAPDQGIIAESRARLGGYIEPGASLTFIPFVSARAVRDTYAVAGTEQLPSLRTRQLAEMYGRENPFVVFLRESNTLTSTVYTPNQRDSFFLFFTDVVPSRPLLGSLNLAAGVGASLAGLAILPLDGGEVLLSGLRGALFSLPELAFVSLRKGSFDYVERKYRPITPAG